MSAWRKPVVLAALLLSAAALAGCSREPTAAGSRFEPVKPGVLTVATAFLPAPVFWEGRSARAGFEAQLAQALARHLLIAAGDAGDAVATEVARRLARGEPRRFPRSRGTQKSPA